MNEKTLISDFRAKILDEIIESGIHLLFGHDEETYREKLVELDMNSLLIIHEMVMTEIFGVRMEAQKGES